MSSSVQLEQGPEGDDFTDSPVSITVHVCAAHFPKRVRLAEILSAAGFVNLRGSSCTEVEAVRRLRTEAPDIAILDSGLGVDTCLTVLHSLNSAGHGTRAIVLMDDRVLHLAGEFADAGAAGVLDSSRLLAELPHAVRLVHHGAKVLPGRITGFAGSEAGASPLHELSEEDQQILRSVAQGLTNAQIGTFMYVSEATVKAHLAQIMRLAGVSNRVQLAVAAARGGLLS